MTDLLPLDESTEIRDQGTLLKYIANVRDKLLHEMWSRPAVIKRLELILRNYRVDSTASMQKKLAKQAKAITQLETGIKDRDQLLKMEQVAARAHMEARQDAQNQLDTIDCALIGVPNIEGSGAVAKINMMRRLTKAEQMIGSSAPAKGRIRALPPRYKVVTELGGDTKLEPDPNGRYMQPHEVEASISLLLDRIDNLTEVLAAAQERVVRYEEKEYARLHKLAASETLTAGNYREVKLVRAERDRAIADSHRLRGQIERAKLNLA